MALRSIIAGVCALVLGPLTCGQGPSGNKVDFEKEVWPILKSSCIECHQASYKDANGRTRTAKADLRLDGKGWILRGSRSEKVVIPGDGDASLLYILTTLEPEEDGFMPRKGRPLTAAQSDLLKQWIDEGAHFGKWVGAEGPAEVVSTAPVEISIPVAMAPIAKLGEGLAPLSSSALKKAAGEHGRISAATKGGPLLRVTYFSNQDRVTDKDVLGLLPVRQRVTQLLLSRTAVTDRALGTIASMNRLTKLDLGKTKVTDRGMAQIAKLAELRSLNLYGTAITDRGLEQLATLKKLERLYVWETQVTEEGVAQLRQALPRVKIVRVLVVPPPLEEGSGNRDRRRRGKKN